LTADVSPTVLVDHLEIPWDLAFTPDGDLFITERVGRVRRVSGDDLATVVEPAAVIDARSVPPGDTERQWWIEGGEGGLLGVAVHPTYPRPPYLYVYYTATRWFGLGRVNRLVRFDAEADDPVSTETVLIDGIPAGRSHNGGRLAFGPENYLWVTTGDAELGVRTHAHAQDVGSLAGKVLRVRPDGTAPGDNPDLGPRADDRVYSYGHRNPQGLAWDGAGRLWATEHGPSARDELNLIEPGRNYGWPEITGAGTHPEMEAPAFHSGRHETWAPAGAAAYDGSVFFAGLRGERLYEARTVDGEVTAFVGHFPGEFGRLRAVTLGPEGEYLYLTTSNTDGRGDERAGDDRLLRVPLEVFRAG
jgi:glucose/arabinose dehydrogenase